MSSISRLLSQGPSSASGREGDEQDPALIAIDDEAADDVFSALSSTTARSILSSLYEEPRTASEIADSTDTSLQNVNYHVNNLRDSDLIRVVDTGYSDQGREMKVYAPTNEALVVFASDDLERDSFWNTLKRLLGGVGLLAVVSLAIDRLVRQPASRRQLTPGTTGPTPSETFSLSPGAIFFLGAVFALLAVAAWWHFRSY
ncbi:helix-turn-helix domain-containing protein [Halorussus sp. MSC15.2]|uniref:ArsR/SmtB family transcription factor n=1 Tax=Halorussus sp. MSC15.2 TaxID=2283638 RepID=UPI0013D48E4E|nr:helix-turn-helix domain-containing protein [Halorussus sp. MSC15.2]NEU58024.1 helix-turn-helix transcriptional regulator [Halorussus sp. MSC15.2]